MKQFFYIILFIFYTVQLHAIEGIEFAPKLTTTAPFFMGAGGTILIHDHFQFNVQYGVNPSTYYNQIAKIAAHYGENAKYEGVVNAAFSENKILKIDLQYNFSGKTGWRTGFSGYILSASGSAGIDEVLGASTGKDYTTLKNLLKALGRSTDVTLESDLKVLELFGGYSWDIGHSIYLESIIGVAKVFTATEHISTGLPNYEASANGSSTLRSTEDDLVSIIKDNGISPTLGVTLSYFF
jgi:hypothetical protein